MPTRMFLSLKKYFLFSFLLAATACTPRIDNKTPALSTQSALPVSDQNPMGKEDGGGGFTLLSTQEEVRIAISKSWRYALHPKVETNPLQRFADWYLKNGKSERVKEIVRHMFISEKNEDNMNQYTYFWDYLKKSGAPITDSGTCGGGGKNHTDGSVSHHAVGATICLNVTSLQKIPTYSLVNEILGLLIHEMAHIKGYEESDAHAVQAAAATFLGRIASGMAADENRETVKKNLSNAQLELTSIFRSREIDPRKTYAIQSIRMATLLLSQIPSFHDEVGLEIGLNADKPIICRLTFEKIKKTEVILLSLLARGKEGSDANFYNELWPEEVLTENTGKSEPVYAVKILDPKYWSTSRETIIEAIEQLKQAEQELNVCFNETI